MTTKLSLGLGEVWVQTNKTEGSQFLKRGQDASFLKGQVANTEPC